MLKKDKTKYISGFRHLRARLAKLIVLMTTRMALLHKAVAERTSSFRGHIYPKIFVTGILSAV